MELGSDYRANPTRFWGALVVLLVIAIALIAAQVVKMSVGPPADAESAVFTLRGENAVLVNVLVWVMLGASTLGLVLSILFLVNYTDSIRNAPAPGVPSGLLIRVFVVYLVSNFVLGAIAASSVALSGIDSAESIGNIVFLTLQTLAVLAAFSLGMGSFDAQVRHSRRSYERVGIRLLSFKDTLKWGIGGYLAALPFFFAAVGISQLLESTVFRNIRTPQHQLVPYVTEGGPESLIIVLILGGLVAPLVEETFFRGVLYSALRDGMGVWGSAMISAIIFALGHPLPAFFLPIFVLGVVFALVREKTGSVIPSMISHGIHNSVTILLAWILL